MTEYPHNKFSLLTRGLLLMGLSASLSGCLITVSHYEGGTVSSDLGADCSSDCVTQLNEGESFSRTYTATALPGNEFVKWLDSFGEPFSFCPQPTLRACAIEINSVLPELEGFPVEITAQFRAVTAYNLNWIPFRDDSTSAEGTFKQIEPGTWIESYPNAIPTNYYTVTGRSEQRMGLYDRFKDVYYFFNLQNGQIQQQLGAAALTDWGTIREGAAGKPNGWLATSVDYGAVNGSPKGQFMLTNGLNWVEQRGGRKPKTFNFMETDRDDSSIYLRDDSRNLDVQIEVYQGKVYSSKNSAPQTTEGYVQNVAQPVNGWVASYVSYTDDSGQLIGHLSERGSNTWVELSADGKEILATYEVDNRRLSEINLVDEQNSVALSVKIDSGIVTRGQLPLNFLAGTYTILEVK